MTEKSLDDVAKKTKMSNRKLTQSDFLNDESPSSESSAAVAAAAAAAIAAVGGSLGSKTTLDSSVDDTIKYTLSPLNESRYKSHHCDQCHQSFARAHDLKRHKLGLHDQVKPYPCPHCGRSFSRQDALSRHLKISETGRAACSALREGKAFESEPHINKKRRNSIHDPSYGSQMDPSLFFHQESDDMIEIESHHLSDRNHGQLLIQNKQLNLRIQSLEAQLMRQSMLSKDLEDQVRQLEMEKEILRNLLSDKSSPDGTTTGFGHSDTVVSGSFLQKV